MTDSRFSSIGQILERRAPTEERELDVPGPARPPSDPDREPGTITRIDEGSSTSRSRQRSSSSAPEPNSATNDQLAKEPVRSSVKGARRVVFRLDPDLHRSLVNKASAERTSYGHVVLDAVEAAHEGGTLPTLLAGTRTQTEEAGLFPRLRPRTDARPAVSVEIRLDARALQILDHLVAQHAAENRTHLMVSALQAYLG